MNNEEAMGFVIPSSMVSRDLLEDLKEEIIGQEINANNENKLILNDALLSIEIILALMNKYSEEEVLLILSTHVIPEIIEKSQTLKIAGSRTLDFILTEKSIPFITLQLKYQFDD